MVNLFIASVQAVPPAVLRRPSRGCPPRGPLRHYPTPSCDACPAPAKVALLRAPPGWGPRRRGGRSALGAPHALGARRGGAQMPFAFPIRGTDVVFREWRILFTSPFHFPFN